ncbi:MAG: sensor histidine kinase [Spirochaetaceae bacterium]|nr:MAG: sensor histidine kinase [Spirochaetaceae bacterium]
MTKTRSSARWANRRLKQRRLVRFGGAAVVLLTLVAVMLVAFPVRTFFYQRDRAQFHVETRLIHILLESHLNQLIEIAAQLSSRTVIRNDMLELREGRMSAAAYFESASPRLEDALVASPEALGVLRLDLEGKVVASAGLAEAIPTRVHLDLDTPRILPMPGSSSSVGSLPEAVIVTHPVVHPQHGALGHDVLLLSFGTARAALDAAMQGTYPTEVRVQMPATRGEGSHSEVGGMEHHSYQLPSGLELVVGRASGYVYGNSNRQLSLIIAVILVAGAALSFASLWMLGLVHERSVAENAELADLVEEQTAQLRELLRERELLIHEVHHRIKNDMSVTRSLLTLQRLHAESSEVQASLAEAESRLGVMAEIYEHLYRQSDVGQVFVRPVLERLLPTVVSSHPSTGSLAVGKPDTIDISVADVQLERDAAIPLSIIANELVINALKYSAQERQAEIRVELYLEPYPTEARTAPAQMLVLRVSDNGPGLPAQVVQGDLGFGLEMARSLAEQSGGGLELPAEAGSSSITVRLKV